MGKSRHQRDYEDQETKIYKEKERQRERQRKQQRDREDLEHADSLRTMIMNSTIIGNQ